MKRYIFLMMIVTLLLSFIMAFGGIALADTAVTLTLSKNDVEASAGDTAHITAAVFNDITETLTEYRVVYNGNTYADGVNLINGAVNESLSIDLPIDESMLNQNLTFKVQYKTATQTEWVDGGTAKLKVNKKMLSVNMAASASVDESLVDRGDKVTFTFQVENQGEATLENIVIKAAGLNNGGALNNEPVSLAAGSAPWEFTYDYTVADAITVTPTITYSANGEAQTPKTLDPIEIKIITRDVDAELTVDNDSPDAGEDVTFTLVLRNNGNVPYTNIKVFYNGIEQGFSTSKLGQDDEASEEYTMPFTKSTDVQFNITLDDHEGSTRPLDSNTVTINIPVDTDAISSGVTMTIDPDVSELASAGTVAFSGRVSNTTDYSLSDVVVSEATIGDVLGPIGIDGHDNDQFSSQVDINETTTYNFVLTFKDEDGQTHTVNADPITVTITAPEAEETNIADDATELTLEQEGGSNSLSTLVILGIVLFVLIIGVGVALLVLWRKGQRPKNASSSKLGGKSKKPGVRKVKPKKRSTGPKGYRDRNNF